jgi:rhamnogalacturonyl hydrolase YesR
LYTLYTRSGGIVTRPPAGVTMGHVVNDRREVREYHYNGGIAAAFLGRLYMATGEQAWLDLARDYQAFSMGSTPRQFETKQVCKSGWGAAILYLITRDETYRDWLVRMGDWFVDEQEPAGNWNNTPYLEPNPTVGDQIGITAEFIVHMDSIIGALATSAVE